MSEKIKTLIKIFIYLNNADCFQIQTTTKYFNKNLFKITI